MPKNPYIFLSCHMDLTSFPQSAHWKDRVLSTASSLFLLSGTLDTECTSASWRAPGWGVMASFHLTWPGPEAETPPHTHTHSRSINKALVFGLTNWRIIGCATEIYWSNLPCIRIIVHNWWPSAITIFKRLSLQRQRLEAILEPLLADLSTKTQSKHMRTWYITLIAKVLSA